MRKTLSIGIVGALATMLAAGPATAQKKPLRIALIEPLSGPIAAVGSDALLGHRFAASEINRRGGVLGGRKLVIVPFDNAMKAPLTLQQLKKMIGDGIRFVTQGIGSNHAINIIKFLNKHNRRSPEKSVLYLNNSAVTTAFTGKLCSFWHFRFDANVDMKVAGMVTQMSRDPAVKRVYMINQNYAYGRSFRSAAIRILKSRAKKIKLVGNELMAPFGRVKDFTPFIAKIKKARADTVLTGNWGPDMTRLVKAAAAAGLKVQFYTIYAGIPTSMAGYGTKAGVAVKIKQITEYHENGKQSSGNRNYALAYKAKHKMTWYTDRYRMMYEMFAAAVNKAGSDDPVKVGRALEGMVFKNAPIGDAVMRAKDHQIHFPMVVSTIDPGAKYPLIYKGKNFGAGFKTDSWISSADLTLPTPCKMKRP